MTASADWRHRATLRPAQVAAVTGLSLRQVRRLVEFTEVRSARHRG